MAGGRGRDRRTALRGKEIWALEWGLRGRPGLGRTLLFHVKQGNNPPVNSRENSEAQQDIRSLGRNLNYYAFWGQNHG